MLACNTPIQSTNCLNFGRPLSILLVALLVCSCTPSEHAESADEYAAAEYATLPDGRTAMLYTIRNNNGVVAQLTDFGAILVSLKTPDRDGNLADVTIGYDTLDGWVNDTSYMGATVGRYGNRIANGTFTLDGKTYQLATNNAPNHLMGNVSVAMNEAVSEGDDARMMREGSGKVGVMRK